MRRIPSLLPHQAFYFGEPRSICAIALCGAGRRVLQEI